MKWLLLAILLASTVIAQEVLTQSITYPSSVSNLTLDALVFTNNESGVKPILVVMHSYAGTSADVVDVSQRFARAGAVVIAPNMRGRSSTQSYQIGDDSMYDLFDVYDGINVLIENFSGDPENINILGYSGGGANVMQMVQKFPDLFGNAYSFFGIPNYCDGDSWYDDGVYNNEHLSMRIGNGSANLTTSFKNRCLARNALKQIPNAKKTMIRLYVDKDEAVAPLRYSQAYAWKYQQQGFLFNVHLDVSDANTAIRYTHGYPKDVADLRVPEQSIAQEVFHGKQDVSLEKKGVLNVGGYVKTKPFTILLGEEVWEGQFSKGREGLVEVRYDLEGRSFEFTDKSYEPGIKNATVIWHQAEPNERVSLYFDGRKMVSTADGKGDASFFVELGKPKEVVSAGMIVLAAVVLVLVVGVVVFFRKRIK